MPLTKIEGPSLGNVTISSITSNASFDSGTLFVDAANNVVGIGNTTPIHKLRVEGTTSVSGNVSIDADLVVTGNLTVSGTTVTVNSENVLIKDNLITLSSNVTGAPVLDAGIEVNRGTSANVILKWNETSDLWQLTNDGTNYGNILTTLSSTGMNASALSTGTVPLAQLTSANSSANGVVDTTTQTFAGLKTFNSNATFSGSRTFFASGSVLDWNSGDVTLTHSANTLTFGGASSGYVFSDGDVGIGTTSIESGFKLHVVGNGFFSSSSGTITKVSVDTVDQRLVLGSYYEAGVGQLSFISSTNNAETGDLALDFRTGTTSRFRITSGGNIAIGAGAKFYLDGTAGTGDTYLYEASANLVQLFVGGAQRFSVDNTGGALSPYVYASGANLIVDAAKKLYLDGGTDTYITESSANKVTVYAGGYGNFIFMGVSGGPVFNLSNVGFGVGSGDKIYFDATAASGGGDTYIYESSANTLRGYVGNTFAWQSGSTIWYHQTELSIPATKKFYLDGGAAAGAGDTYIYEQSSNRITVTAGNSQYTFSGDLFFPETDNARKLGESTNRWSVVYAVNGTIQTSDRTLKRDISTDTLGLDFVQKLRPVSFTMRDEADGTRRHGLIAQDVIEAAEGQSLLGILTGEKDGEYGLNYAGFVPALIAAIQQQQNEINALKARLATLEG